MGVSPHFGAGSDRPADENANMIILNPVRDCQREKG
jgi:hypothetical protein